MQKLSCRKEASFCRSVQEPTGEDQAEDPVNLFSLSKWLDVSFLELYINSGNN